MAAPHCALLHKPFRRISEARSDVKASNLEKCLLYLSPIALQFLGFIHGIILDFIFCCVTVKNQLFCVLGK